MGKFRQLFENLLNLIQNITQLNDNEVEKWSNIDVLVSNKELKTIYLERNPVANESGYRRKIKLTIPWIVQIDATLAGQ